MVRVGSGEATTKELLAIERLPIPYLDLTSGYHSAI